MVVIKDSTFHEIITFLDAADQHGENILTVIAPGVNAADDEDAAKHNVRYEARQLKKIFLQLRD
jgi:tetratricopeptide repeat protein 30